MTEWTLTQPSYPIPVAKSWGSSKLHAIKTQDDSFQSPQTMCGRHIDGVNLHILDGKYSPSCYTCLRAINAFSPRNWTYRD